MLLNIIVNYNRLYVIEQYSWIGLRYNNSMKQQYLKNLRCCQNIKENDCFIEASGLQKKVRKLKLQKEQNSNNAINADMMMRQIQCFWKEDWEYNHTHHIYMEPRVTRPNVYIQNSLQASRCQLSHYYQLLSQFITKLKIEHQDETNYKINVQIYPDYKPYLYEQELRKTASIALRQLLGIFKRITGMMINQLEESKQEMNDLMIEEEENCNGVYLKFIQQICSKLLYCEEQNFKNKQLSVLEFMTFVSKKLFEAKESPMFSGLILVQPLIGELTYFIHPLCLGIYTHFHQQVLIKQALKLRGKVFADEKQQKLTLDHELLNQASQTLLQIQDNPRLQQQKHSKIVMINLDGYQSQFNIQFMRNFSNHTMYVSFPKYQKKDTDQQYNKRFYKKIMFNYTKPQISLLASNQFQQQFSNDELTSTLKRQQLTENPQKYHQNIQTIYSKPKNPYQVIDLNKNIYIYPVGMQNLQNNKYMSPEQKTSMAIEPYESYFVRYILRNYIYSQIRKFSPTIVMISYTGKIGIESEHFLQIMQQLQKICPRVMLFPNFTTTLVEEEMNTYYDNYEEEKTHAYDKLFTSIGRDLINIKQNEDRSLDLYQKIRLQYERDNFNPSQVDLMNKIAIFLKVSSGNYNIMRPFQEQQFQAKLKNIGIFKYLIYLFGILQDEYDHCKKRIQIDSLEAAQKIMQRGFNEHSKQLQKCISPFHRSLFQGIFCLIQKERSVSSRQNELQIAELHDRYPDPQQLYEDWSRLRKLQELGLANAKYHQISYIQLRQGQSKNQFLQTKDDKMNNTDGIYKLTFSYKDHNTNQIVKIYKEATLLYETNQRFQHKNIFYLIISNIFNPDQSKIQHYITKPQLNNKKMQRCRISPIAFYGKKGIIEPFHLYKIWTQWNYAQTEHHQILYWPKQFDYVTYYIRKLLKKRYEGKVLKGIYACLKSQGAIKGEQIFFQVIIPQQFQIIPRWGCSNLNLNDQMYIFGGFHDRESSYLDMQNQISHMDLTDFDPKDFTPRKLHNLQKDMYCGQAFKGRLREGKKVNSYVRPRLQFQFFEEDDLQLNQNMLNQQNVRKVIMIGGYGQDFKTPYSLLVNFYYILRFQMPTGRLLSIQKKISQGQVIPINIKAMIRNRGVFQKGNILDQREGNNQDEKKCKDGITNNNHYFAHRVVYAMKGEKIQAKIKTLVALQLYQNCKKDFINFAKRVGQFRITEQPDTVQIKKIQNNKHQVLIELGGVFYLYSLYLGMKGEQNYQIPLTNQSIIALDTKKLTIYALVSHTKHTQNRTILVTETVMLPDAPLIQKDKHYALTLSQLHTFNINLNLHTLIACNQNQVALLHGIAFEGTTAVEHLIKTKVKNSNEIKKQTAETQKVSSDMYSSIFSFFFKKNNMINSINLLSYADDSGNFTFTRSQLDIQKFSDGWKETFRNIKMKLMLNGNILKNIRIQIKLDNYFDPGSYYIIVTWKGRNFYMKLTNTNQQNSEVNLEEMKFNQEERFKNFQNLSRVQKCQQKYDDFGYYD